MKRRGRLNLGPPPPHEPDSANMDEAAALVRTLEAYGKTDKGAAIMLMGALAIFLERDPTFNRATLETMGEALGKIMDSLSAGRAAGPVQH